MLIFNCPFRRMLGMDHTSMSSGSMSTILGIQTQTSFCCTSQAKADVIQPAKLQGSVNSVQVTTSKILRPPSPSLHRGPRALTDSKRNSHLCDTTNTAEGTPRLQPDDTRQHSAWGSSHGQSNLQLHLCPCRKFGLWIKKGRCHRAHFVAFRVARTLHIGKQGDFCLTCLLD